MPKRAALDVRPSRAAYPSWLRRKFRIDAVAKGRAYYEIVAARLKEQVAGSSFWAALADRLEDYDAEYAIATGFRLTLGSFPAVEIKGWDRFLDKTFRLNVQDNECWPAAPDGGWLIPPAWFSSIDDVVRTLFVVKYLDGVDYLGSKIEQVAEEHGLRSKSTLEHTELGYYAGHVVVAMQLQVPLETWSLQTQEIPFEIQVTTQMQELIRKLLHPHYEAHQSEEPSGREWQWEYAEPEFGANYLGHIIHYLEGQIMKVREEAN